LLDSLSYFYVGWALQTEWIAEEATNDVSTVFAEAFREVLEDADPSRLHADWTFVDESGETCTVYRLRDGIERFFIEDINEPSRTSISQSDVPVMWDKIDLQVSEFNHVPGGGNVLYMDGHVKFAHYPDDFPTSRAWVELVDVMDF
jgi:prepilin-type processing-associated H-X9-DG protein